jgi:hypothetical protein
MIGTSGLCLQDLAFWQCYEEKLIPFDSLRKGCMTIMGEIL